MMRWRGWENAESYDDYAKAEGVYRWLNRALVERADLHGSRRVLDLGCGTGATALAGLGALAVDGEWVGVDGSPEMLDVARTTVADPRLVLVCADGLDFGSRVDGPFDAAISNAAIWQLGSIEGVLEACAPLLAAGAPLTFDIPAARVGGQRVGVHPFQIALGRLLRDELGRHPEDAVAAFDPSRLRDAAERAGFVVELDEEIVWRGTQGDLVALMQIPAMIEGFAPTLHPDARDALVGRAAARVDLEASVGVPWRVYRLRRLS